MESLGLSNSGAMKVCIGGGTGFNLNRKRKLEEEVRLFNWFWLLYLVSCLSHYTYLDKKKICTMKRELINEMSWYLISKIYLNFANIKTVTDRYEYNGYLDKRVKCSK